jgi:hypothetical protein
MTWTKHSQEHSMCAKGISTSPIYFQSNGIKSKSIDQFVKTQYEKGGDQWMLHNSEYVLSTINPRASYGFIHKPTTQDIMKLFKNRVRGTGNFTIFKKTKLAPRMIYESWLGACRQRHNYQIIAFYEVPIEKIRR